MMTADFWIALAVAEAFTAAMTAIMTTAALENKRSKTTMIIYSLAIIGTAVLYTLICVAYGVI